MVARRGDKFIDPSTKEAYILTDLVFDGNYAILKEVGGYGDILLSQNKVEKVGSK